MVDPRFDPQSDQSHPRSPGKMPTRFRVKILPTFRVPNRSARLPKSTGARRVLFPARCARAQVHRAVHISRAASTSTRLQARQGFPRQNRPARTDATAASKKFVCTSAQTLPASFLRLHTMEPLPCRSRDRGISGLALCPPGEDLWGFPGGGARHDWTGPADGDCDPPDAREAAPARLTSSRNDTVLTAQQEK